MASSAVIGALRVVLGLDTASFEDGVKKANKQSESFVKGMSKIAAGIGLERGIEKSVQVIVAGFKHAIMTADDLSKAAQKAGTSVEALSGLKFAGELSDVPLEKIVGGFQKLSKAMLDAQLGADKAEESFAILGVSFQQGGRLRDVDQVFLDIAQKFSQMDEGATKTALALRLFGKSGAELLPLLNEGRGGIEKFIETAKRMGLVISTETASQSQRFNDNLKIITAAAEGFANKVMEKVLPAMVRFTNEMVTHAESGDKTSKWAEKVTEGLKGVVRWAMVAIEAMGILKDISALQLTLFTRPKDLIDDFKDLKKRILEFPMFVAKSSGEIEALFAGMGNAAGSARKNVDALGETIGQKIAKSILDLKFQTAELNGLFNHLPEGFAAAAQGIGMSIEQIRMGMVNGSQATRNWIQAFAELNAAKAVEAATPQWEKDQQALDRMRVSLVLSGKTAEETAKIVGAAAGKMASSWQSAMTNITSNLASGFANLASVYKKFSVVAKAAAYAQAIWNTYSAANLALATYPPPLSYAAAAAAIVAGLGNVAKIQSQSFAGGGSFKVPGGISGTDNKFVPLNLASGEMVKVTPAQKVDAQQAAGGDAQEITLRTRGIGEMLTMDDLRGIVNLINQGTRDGYRLKIA